MEPYIFQFLLAVLLAFATSWISVQLSIKKFHSQKWWERKEETYSHIIEELYNAKNYIQRLKAPIENGQEIGGSDSEKAYMEKYEKSCAEIYKAEGIGAFIISNTAAEILTEFRQYKPPNTPSHIDSLEAHLFSVEKCLDKLRDEAKRDLEIA